MQKFEDYLENIKYPKSKDSWDVAGIIKGHNAFYKFDTKPLINNRKKGSFKTQADKFVVDLKNQYVVLDIEELHCYLKENKLKKVRVEDLISQLDWNIILPKN